MSKKIIINLGDKAALITLIKKDKIVQKLLVADFTEETFGKIKPFFVKNKRVSVYILLDTIAQNYNHRTFPAVNRLDLFSLVNRKFKQEIPKTDLKGKILIDRDKFTKKWNYLFISTAINSPLKEWLEFINEMPNRLIGVYMVPLEMCNLVKHILGKMDFSNTPKPKWVLIITDNQTSDIRQVALGNNALIFTRLLTKGAMSANFGESLKNDILRTCEYLRRFSTAFKMKDLMVITITDPELKSRLDTIQLPEASFVNLTPFEATTKFAISTNGVAKTEKFSDTLINSSFLKNKKVFRFFDPKIERLNRLFFTYRLVKAIILLFACFSLLTFGTNSVYNLLSSRKVNTLKKEIAQEKIVLQRKTEKKFGLEDENVEEIMDMGSLKVLIERAKKNPYDLFEKFYNVQKDLGTTYSVKWKITNIDYKRLNPNLQENGMFEIVLINETGNIDDLFKNYDVLIKLLKSNFPEAVINYSKLPSNIDFNSKYYTFPLRVQIIR